MPANDVFTMIRDAINTTPMSLNCIRRFINDEAALYEIFKRVASIIPETELPILFQRPVAPTGTKHRIPTSRRLPLPRRPLPLGDADEVARGL